MSCSIPLPSKLPGSGTTEVPHMVIAIEWVANGTGHSVGWGYRYHLNTKFTTCAINEITTWLLIFISCNGSISV